MQFLIKSCFPVNHYQQNIELGLLKKYTLAVAIGHQNAENYTHKD